MATKGIRGMLERLRILYYSSLRGPQRSRSVEVLSLRQNGSAKQALSKLTLLLKITAYGFDLKPGLHSHLLTA